MARNDFYLIRLNDREAVTYSDFEQALEAFEETDGTATVRLVSGDGTWSDETMDFEEELNRRDPEASACYRADRENKRVRELV